MHKARAFFFVCAGIFLLALSYHLGARSAGAQAPPYFDVLSCNVVRVGDAIYKFQDGDTAWLRVSDLPPVPPSNLVAFGCTSYAILHDGEGWLRLPGGTWVSVGYAPAATPAQGISIGQLKAKYATPAGK